MNSEILIPPLLSVIIPVYNSQETIEELVKKLQEDLKDFNPEIVLVNDCSRDHSEKICNRLAAEHSNLRFISLRKNSGEHNAVLCGLRHCSGAYAAIIDDDLQNPPSEIIKLLNKAVMNNYDVVYAKYENKKHNFFRNLASKLHNIMAGYLLGKPDKLYLCSFKVISREVIGPIISYRGPYPYLDALILKCTSNIGSELVIHHSREHGVSNYTLTKLVALYLNTVINYSTKPLRFVTISGFIISMISCVVAAFIIYERFVYHNIPPGWSFLAILLLFMLGLTFSAIGLIGEYIGKILMSLNNTPQYVVKEMVESNEEHKNIVSNYYDRQSSRV
ncbi:MAG: glycosyltransferase family 2 protein [Pyrinomonadaceae bacterium]|nr:glycosyltransferase family 2 protein [Sphingobacteriaceae bacterium]